jgi:ketol-acid reductoisomerase
MLLIMDELIGNYIIALINNGSWPISARCTHGYFLYVYGSFDLMNTVGRYRRRSLMKELRVGLIGLGNMGKIHIANCQHMDDVTVVAAADSSKRALTRANRLGVKGLYSSYDELFKHADNLDCVIISLPNFLHYDCIKQALDAGLG